MSMVDMSLDDIAKKEGIKPRRGGPRGRRGGRRTGGTPVTNTQQRRKSIEQHTERAQKHRNERRASKRAQDSDKPQYLPVVFGNGTPEKVLTGRLNDTQVAKDNKKDNKKEPVSLVQAALQRGREVFLKKQARGRGKEQGGKRATATQEQRKRHVIPQPLSRKLHIVRPGDPGYQRQLRQLRNRTYSVQLVRQQPRPKQPLQPKRTQKTIVHSEPAPAQRLMGPQSRRIALGMSKNAGSSSPAGPMSNRFSSLNQK